jgi:glycyl-tRNA synthetase
LTVKDEGVPAHAILSEALPALISSLSFSKTMRWQPLSDVAFSRPVRWLLALHGDACVDFSVGSLSCGRRTRLLRTSSPSEVEVQNAGEYLATLGGSGILLDPEERRAEILSAVHAAAQVHSAPCVSLRTSISPCIA